MKKTVNAILLVAALTLSINAPAQKKPNEFKGTITMTTSAGGNTQIQEYKVFDNKILILQQGRTTIFTDTIVMMTADLSSPYTMMKSTGMGDDLKGNGKFIITDTLSIEENLASENYKIEYLDETKKIQGFDAKKANVTLTNEETGEALTCELWYSSEIGPEYTFHLQPFQIVKGFPLEFKITTKDGSVIEMITTEIKKGKVKNVDMLLPAGYENISKEDFQETIKMIQEAMSGGQ